jgi:2-phosphosulfolactate phosphatase
MTGVVDIAWGVPGARYLAGRSDVLVVVDVLSFSTAVSVAVERGALVWPYEFGSDGAELFAREVDAELARGRSVSQGPTLSPHSLLELQPGSRLVLPSPNGSTVSRAALTTGLPVVSACLRSAGATARWLARYPRVGVVAAGEQWVDGSLRPAYEDLVGAGAVVAGLAAKAYRRSPDAAAAVEAARRPRPLAECMSGVELVDRGFAHDVELAQERDVTGTVAVLTSGRFVGVDASEGAG